MLKLVEYYWKPQTIDRMEPWKQITSQVDGKRSEKGCEIIENSEESKSGKQEL